MTMIIRIELKLKPYPSVMFSAYVVRSSMADHLPHNRICLHASVEQIGHQQDTQRSVQAEHQGGAFQPLLLQTDQSHPLKSRVLVAVPRSAINTMLNTLPAVLTI
jgi:hypothetical protein